MKRISMLCVLILLITKNVCASDLSATLSYLNIISNEDLHYITQEGNICCLKDSKTNTIYNSIADVFSSPLIDKGLFLNNVKAFAESYNLNQYYYIDMFGYLYQYNIDDDINQYRKIDGISNCEKVCCGSDFIIALE